MKQNQRDTNNPSSKADNAKGGHSQQAGSNQTPNPKRAGEANEGPIVAGNEKKSASSNDDQRDSNRSGAAKSRDENTKR